MQAVLQTLADANINILGSVTNDSAEYGIIRMIVSDPDLAHKLLLDAGYLCRIGDVLGIELVDEPGSLSEFLKVLKEINVNVDYIYLCYNRETGRPVLIFHTESINEVEASLLTRGFEIH